MKRSEAVLPALCAALLVLAILSIRLGAVPIGFSDMWAALRSDSPDLTQRIFLQIRLPRAILTLLVGGSLGLGGVLLQGLFRNPIVEPGLVGTSSGAAFGAALYFVLGSALHLHTGEWTLPIAAAAGGAAA